MVRSLIFSVPKRCMFRHNFLHGVAGPPYITLEHPNVHSNQPVPLDYTWVPEII